MASTIDIDMADGTARGTRERGVGRWRSIPYAAPPVGPLRLRAPQPPTPWSGVFDATRFRNAAIQNKGAARIGLRTVQPVSEDALTVNVTAPLRPSTAPRPVMVFIHGGGYVFGTSALALYGGRQLALRGDLILVSMNYRLGIFGYADFSRYSTDERTFDSNCGLRDQVAALEWVQRNIAAFGGDPDNVTIFGESAGAASVVTLLATPAAEGLFHRAIAESAPADWAVDSAGAAAYAARCVDLLGATDDTAAEVLANTDAESLRRAGAKAVRSAMTDCPGYMPAVPVVDGNYLPAAPIDAMAAGTAHPVPLIIGTNRNEGTLFARRFDQLPLTPKRIDEMFDVLAPEARQRVVAAYPGYPAAAKAVRLGGDFMFLRPTIAACEAHSAHAPTYNYRYDFAPKALQRSGFGATHASEMLAVFGVANSAIGRAVTVGGGRRALLKVTEQIQSQWISFARHGRPLPSWPRYTTQNRRTLVFDTPTKVANDLDRGRRLAWRGMPGPQTVRLLDSATNSDPTREATG
ncbi:carboxylesterase/lipase family protein [Aldersonia sp. NBC_00410]|uniref:carboxylesterase/lipase family protein n=1 Tax=Aldersonia sp. NBC_00410 TaxID=2975954 RepID=UPI00224EFF9A|nr:carboxylesterase/lipase family protein [Aldersonia sp. NBC_00410]MCX5045611.1 carboxylesterase/lipase family protein [Aldersonia sp. NBC_00410]